MEELAQAGLFSPPRLRLLEDALECGIAMKRGRVFADLWDVRKPAACPICAEDRIARLHAMNLQQRLLPPVDCERCGGLS